MQYKESQVICSIRVYPLKKTGFSMVQYSVNQAICDKKSVIKIQNSMFTKCDINNTYKSSGIQAHTSGTVSPIQAAIRTFQISPAYRILFFFLSFFFVCCVVVFYKHVAK